MKLHSKIILGLILGLILGIVAVFSGIGQFISDWVMPFGTIFVKMLKLVAVPLILVSLISGISNDYRAFPTQEIHEVGSPGGSPGQIYYKKRGFLFSLRKDCQNHFVNPINRKIR